MQKKLFDLPPPVHGGDLFPNQRKRRRPLARNTPIHLVLKAERDFGANRGHVLLEAERLANRFNLELLDNAVHLDHLHLVISTPGRREFNAFLRSLAGLLARRMGKGIWRALPFTRVAGWGKELEALNKYCWRNRMEAAGGIPYEEREDPYRHWR